MMEQLGVDIDELDAEEIRITLDDGRELVFYDAEVNHLSGQGMNMYQITGSPDEEKEANQEDPDESDEDGPTFTDGDVEIVAERAGVSEEEARDALAANDGDLAAAIENLN